jgi:uncharacterized protein (DUF433 family)
MATAAKTVFPHITTDPDVMSGRPCIAGTRIRVMDVVAAYEEGVSLTDLQNYFSTRPLTLGEIHAALSYYNDHKEEIEAHFAEHERVYQEGLAWQAEFLKKQSDR